MTIWPFCSAPSTICASGTIAMSLVGVQALTAFPAELAKSGPRQTLRSMTSCPGYGSVSFW